MKQLLFALLLTLVACNKNEMSVPLDTTLRVNLNSFEPYQYELPVDSILFKFNPRYSSGYRGKEDSLNVRQANDLFVIEDNQSLTVDALPIKEDSIPLVMQNLIGTEYKMKFKFSEVVPEVEVWLIEKLLNGTLYRKLITPDLNSIIFYNDGKVPASERFSLLFKRS
jgi:hypothetical protein